MLVALDSSRYQKKHKTLSIECPVRRVIMSIRLHLTVSEKRSGGAETQGGRLCTTYNERRYA